MARIVLRAREENRTPSVLTFAEHPQGILRPDAKPLRLMALDHKLAMLAESGIERCCVVSFSPEFASLEPEAFVKDVMIGRFGAKRIVLGYNARFGRGRSGDSALMAALAAQLDFTYEELPPVSQNGEDISSSRVRKLVEDGDLKDAAACLGRPFSLLGQVIKGRGLGRQIGFPTANLQTEVETLPPYGVYPVLVREFCFERRETGRAETVSFKPAPAWMRGLLNFGLRPTFTEPKAGPVLEVHLLDFKGDLYGKQLEVALFSRLRPEEKFQDTEALKRQIRLDIAEAGHFFGCLESLGRAQKNSFTRN